MHRLTIARLAAGASFLTLTACGAAASTGAATSSGVAAATSASSTASTATPTAPPTPIPSTPTATKAPLRATPRPTAAPTQAMAHSMMMRVVMTAMTRSGTALVAASNGRTLYTFNSDSAGSGRTNCNSGCVGEWPPLTIAAGVTPTGGTSVTGTFGTIVRADGRRQVTYKGLALYFFSGDTGPAQTNGQYPGWSLAMP